MAKYIGPILGIAVIIALVLVVGFALFKNQERIEACKHKCHPVVSKRMDQACYCADGDDWKLKYKDKYKDLLK